jgi:hypothetical protein
MSSCGTKYFISGVAGITVPSALISGATKRSSRLLDDVVKLRMLSSALPFSTPGFLCSSRVCWLLSQEDVMLFSCFKASCIFAFFFISQRLKLRMPRHAILHLQRTFSRSSGFHGSFFHIFRSYHASQYYQTEKQIVHFRQSACFNISGCAGKMSADRQLNTGRHCYKNIPSQS